MREKITAKADGSALSRHETAAFGALIAQADQLRPEFIELARTAKAIALRRASDRKMPFFQANGLWQKTVFASLALLLLSLPFARLADPEARTVQTPSSFATRTSSAEAPSEHLGQEFTAASDQLFDPYASDWPTPSMSLQN